MAGRLSLKRSLYGASAGWLNLSEQVQGDLRHLRFWPQRQAEF